MPAWNLHTRNVVATLPVGRDLVGPGSVSRLRFVVEQIELAGELEHATHGSGHVPDCEARTTRNGVVARAEENADTAGVEVRHAGEVDDHGVCRSCGLDGVGELSFGCEVEFAGGAHDREA